MPVTFLGDTKPGATLKDASSARQQREVPSLDFERIINSYSIQATKARLIKAGKKQGRVRGSSSSSSKESGTSSTSRTRRDGSNDDVGQASNSTASLDDPFLPCAGRNGEGDVTTNEAATTIIEPETGSPDEESPLLQGSGDKPEKKKLKLNYSGQAATRWLFTCATGLLTGLMCIFIVFCVEIIGGYRSSKINRVMTAEVPNGTNGGSMSPLRVEACFVNFAGFNLALALAACLLTVLRAPSAAGSGIPEVKAYLNGVRVTRFDSFNLFLAKIFGTIFSVSSGLALGPEGPLVHLGAILGSSVTKTGKVEHYVRAFRRKYPTLSGLCGCASDMQELMDVIDVEKSTGGEGLNRVKKRQVEKDKKKGFLWESSIISSMITYSSHFRNDAERRDFISVGAAAGFAAAFGAPIGGVLYSLEETSSFFANSLLLKTLAATAIATFSIAVYHGDLTRYSVIVLSYKDASDRPDEDSVAMRFAMTPLYVLVGLVGGLLGALWNSAVIRIGSWRKSIKSNMNEGAVVLFSILEVTALSIVTSTVLFWSSVYSPWACKDVEDVRDAESQYSCGTGQYSELGKVFFGSRDEAIIDILQDTQSFELMTLFLVGTVFYVLMIITQGTAIPSGIFMPCVLVGSALGGCAGLWLKQTVNGEIDPATIALLGAAALLAGMQRSTISLCVILMEGTGQTKVLIPVIIVVVVATNVGNLFNHGIYEMLIHQKGYEYLEHAADQSFDVFRVRDVMTSPVLTLGRVEQAGKVERLLMETDHHGFPVVDEKTQRFLGLVRRDQLCALLECRVFMKKVSSRDLYSALGSTEEGNEEDDSDDGDGDGDVAVAQFPEPSPRRLSLIAQSSFARQRYSMNKSLLESRIDSFDIADTLVRDNSVLLTDALTIKDDRYDQDAHHKEGKSCWDHCQKPAEEDPLGSHEWFDDTIMVSRRNLVTVGLDETMPKHGEEIQTKDATLVSVVDGRLVVYIAPEDRSKKVNVSAVMNRGAYTITEGVPLSKAYELFTKLGLRYLVVLGGKGQVIGMITRANLNEHYLEEKTGYKLS